MICMEFRGVKYEGSMYPVVVVFQHDRQVAFVDYMKITGYAPREMDPTTIGDYFREKLGLDPKHWKTILFSQPNATKAALEAGLF